jgi:dipeptidyl aminopeptidase/acylaminoacyl peptidase
VVAGEGDLITFTYSDAVPAPDGASLAWVSDVSGRPRAWVAPFDGTTVGPPRPVPGFDEDVAALSWSPDGLWLAAQLAPGGGERTRVRLVGPGGVVDIAPAARAVTLGAWSPGGYRLGITIFGPGSGDGQACLVDVRDGTSTVLASGPAARVCAVSGDGRRAVVRLGRRGARELELVDLRSGLRTPLLPGGGATVADARFDRSRLYVHTDAGHDRPVLLAVDLRGRSATRVVAARRDADLDIVALDPDAARGTLVWNVDGRSELELLDLRSGRSSPLVPPPGDVVSGVAFTRDGRALLVGSEGPGVPPRISHVPLSGGSAGVLLGDPPPPAPVEPDLVAFTGEDGLALSGWLFRPRHPPGPAGPRHPPGPVPVLIWLHGGPEAQERPVFQPLFQALLAAGIAVFAPNVRGSGGYGRAFVAADDGALRHVAITDVRAAVRFLVDAGHADPDRIGVAGRSYGGYLTLVALAWYPELFVVGVDVCGMSDLHTFYRDTEPWIAEAATTEYGDPARDADLLRELSPIHRVDRISAPLLVVHGAQDTNVPVGEAVQVVDALRERGRTVDYLLFDGEGHEVRGVANRARFVDEVVRWVAGPLLDAPVAIRAG